MKVFIYQKGIYVYVGYKVSETMSIEEVAKKDTPRGVPFLILEESELPLDVPTEAWEVDFSNPDGYGLGPQRWFIQQAEEAIERGEDVEGNTALIAQMQAELEAME